MAKRSLDESRRYSHIAQLGLISIKHPQKMKYKIFVFPSGTSAEKTLSNFHLDIVYGMC